MKNFDEPTAAEDAAWLKKLSFAVDGYVTRESYQKFLSIIDRYESRDRAAAADRAVVEAARDENASVKLLALIRINDLKQWSEREDCPREYIEGIEAERSALMRLHAALDAAETNTEGNASASD